MKSPQYRKCMGLGVPLELRVAQGRGTVGWRAIASLQIETPLFFNVKTDSSGAGEMWSLLFCAECFSWAIPTGGHCPECMASLRPETPDPAPETLLNAIGELRWKLGYCRAVRRGGEIPGTLYLTSRGLFFAPHHVQETLEIIENYPQKSWAWVLVEFAIPPVKLFSWLTSLQQRKQQVPVRTFYPQLLLPEDSPLLPRLLMGNPGAFFLPRQRVQALFHTHGRWTIDRTRGRDVVLLEDPEDRQLSENIFELRQFVEWRSPLALQ